MIVNLITNAIKFTKEGFIRYGYRLREDRVEFYVADTGLGIPEDKLSTIFTRFTKLNSFIAGTGARTGHLPDDRRTAAWENMGRIETGRRFDIPV